MLIAVTRKVSPSIARCELTHLPRTHIDFERAHAQHAGYERTLEALGCEVLSLPAEPDLPDSVFVEDTAVVLPEVAVIARPGAESRRPETASIATALAPYRDLVHMAEPATLDGGDVLVFERTVFVGLSSRTNEAGAEQLRTTLSMHGYRTVAVEPSGCLHLKSAASVVAANTLLVNRELVDAAVFGDAEIVDVHPSEPRAANALLIGETAVLPAAYVRTRERLEVRGISTAPVDISELAKAESGVTCSCLLVGPRVGPSAGPKAAPPTTS